MWRKDFLLHETWKLWSLENSADSFFFCFWLAFLQSVPFFFSLYWSLSLSFCTVFDSISSNIDEVFSINSSANMLLPGDFNNHHKDWLIYSGGTDTSGELCHNFIKSQMTLFRWLTFLLGSQTVILSPAFLDLCLSSNASIFSTMAFPPLENSDYVVVSVSTDFPPYS